MPVDSVVTKLKAKIAFHESEAKRLRVLMDAIVREVGDDDDFVRPHVVPPPQTASQRYRGMKFQQAVSILLGEKSPLTAAQITDLLLAGGFETESDQPRRNVSSLLDRLEKMEILEKSGSRDSGGVVWSLASAR